jgi:enterobacterial common antigen flippase
MVDRRLVRDTAALAIGQVVVRLVGLVSTFYVARALGPTAFGLFSLGLGLALLLSAGAGLGFDDLVVRELARASSAGAALLADALVARLTVLPIGVLAAVALSVAHPDRGVMYLALLAYGLLHSYVLLVCAVFRARGRMPLQSLLLGVEVLLIGGCAVLSAWTTSDPAAVALGYAAAAGAAFALGSSLLRLVGVAARWRGRPATWPSRARAALPFAATTVGLLLYDRLALFGVASIVGQADAGWFGAAHNIVLGLANAPVILMLAAFPGLARTAHADADAVRPAALALTRLVAALGFGLAAALELLAPTIVPLVFGADYAPAVDLLRALALGAPPFFVTVVLAFVLEASDRQVDCARAIGGTLAVAVPGTLAAVWLLGTPGGAAAYVGAHVLLAGVLAHVALHPPVERSRDRLPVAALAGAGDGG